MSGSHAHRDPALDEQHGLVTRLLEDEEKRRRHLPRIGSILSGLYLGGLMVYLWVQGQNPATLDLNELGDFLGGVSSPLAFLWLVLGFFQSSREIGISSKALHLQAREMRAEMRAQRELAASGSPGGEAPSTGSG